MTARTFCKLGIQRRLVWTFEWLTLWPVVGPLSHTEQRLDTVVDLQELGDSVLTRSINITQGPSDGKEADPALTIANVGNTNMRLVGFDGRRVTWETRVPTAE